MDNYIQQSCCHMTLARPLSSSNMWSWLIVSRHCVLCFHYMFHHMLPYCHKTTFPSNVLPRYFKMCFQAQWLSIVFPSMITVCHGQYMLQQHPATINWQWWRWINYLLTASAAAGDGGGKWKQMAGTRPSRPVELHTRHLVTELESSTTHSSPVLTYTMPADNIDRHTQLLTSSRQRTLEMTHSY